MAEFLKVIIMKGQRRAKDTNGCIYEIHGLEIMKAEGGVKEVYYHGDRIFKAIAAAGTECWAYPRKDGSLMLR